VIWAVLPVTVLASAGLFCRDHSGRGLPDVRLDGYAFCHLRHVF